MRKEPTYKSREIFGKYIVSLVPVMKEIERM